MLMPELGAKTLKLKELELIHEALLLDVNLNFLPEYGFSCFQRLFVTAGDRLSGVLPLCLFLVEHDVLPFDNISDFRVTHTDD